MERFIYLVSIGEIERELIEFLKSNVEKIFNYKVKEYPHLVPIPSEAYNPKRKQYYSNQFLKLLSTLIIEDAFIVLGITNVDLYTDRLNFIFGQAILGGRESIISLARLDSRFYNLPFDKELLKIRALKEAVHEIGHTLGLSHCPNPTCVMYFSNSLSDTDRKSYNFCDLCKLRLSNSF